MYLFVNVSGCELKKTIDRPAKLLKYSPAGRPASSFSAILRHSVVFECYRQLRGFQPRGVISYQGQVNGERKQLVLTEITLAKYLGNLFCLRLLQKMFTPHF